jgi:hypothetical protein
MLKLASISAVHTAAQYYGMPSTMASPMPMASPMGYGAPEVMYGAAPVYMGAPVYTDFAQPAVPMPQYEFPASQPAVPVPQYDMAVPEVPQATPEAAPQGAPIPHPDTVKAEQVSYLQKAVENLDTQKQSERTKVDDEKTRITADANAQLQKLLADAEARLDGRLGSLDSAFRSYEGRLQEQSEQLKRQFYTQRAQARFDDYEKRIKEIYEAETSLRDLDSLKQGQELRQQNRQQLQSDLAAIQTGEIPPELLDPDAPVDAPAASEDLN